MLFITTKFITSFGLVLRSLKEMISGYKESSGIGNRVSESEGVSERVSERVSE
jgi:hypothetical protein